jgi:hypothetical protein
MLVKTVGVGQSTLALAPYTEIWVLNERRPHSPEI